MATISTPADIFEHTMDVVSGFNTTPGRLDFTANLSANVSLIPYEGRIVHLTSAGEWAMGCVAKKVPCVLLKPSVPYGHQPTMSPYWRAIGKYPMAALPVISALQIATTEFDTAKTYAVGDWLTAAANNTNQDTGGVLTNTVPGNATALTVPWAGGGTTKTIVGQVCRAVEALRSGNTVLHFWTVFIPGSTDS